MNTTDFSNELPIIAFRDEIMATIEANKVTIVTAETGAGKSTQVPQWMVEAGYEVVVTQPRRLATRTVAARVAEEMDVELGSLIGWRVRDDGAYGELTRGLFCTDGLALVRELTNANRGILVIDEVHEWNENIEVLVAWVKHQVQAGVDFKLVLMSATMESQRLSEFFDNAPVVKVPGRLFHVEEQAPGKSIEADVEHLVKAGHNVLVFQPGKAEISETVATLENMGLDAEILPLHGELSPAEQDRCYGHYRRPKVVVATNVAQTSITIDDIDAVVDSGMERRKELVDGVEGLYLRAISLADRIQRCGRAGRTRPGIYIDHCPEWDRLEFPKAEIERTRLDQTYLRLLIAGFDMEELEFFHQPDRADIHAARRVLVGLGCITPQGEVTKVGRMVNRLPVSVQCARMLLEADRQGVLADVLTAAAIFEVDGIVEPPPSRNRPDRADWRYMLPSGKRWNSDVLAQMYVWDRAEREKLSVRDLELGGVIPKRYHRAREVRRSLAGVLKSRSFKLISSGNETAIMKAICAGMVDHLYQGPHSYHNGDEVVRELGNASVVSSQARWLVGLPFDLEAKARRGGTFRLHLLNLATVVDPTWLVEVAPHLVKIVEGIDPQYDIGKDVVTSITRTVFNDGHALAEERVDDPHHVQATEVLAGALVSGQLPLYARSNEIDDAVRANVALRRRASELAERAGADLSLFDLDDESVTRHYVRALQGARCLAEVADPEALRLPELDVEMVSIVMAENPNHIIVCGEELPVEYRRPSSWSGVQAPLVHVGDNTLRRTGWLRKLLDQHPQGVTLPGGRLVAFSARPGGMVTTERVEVPDFVAQVCRTHQMNAWNSFLRSDVAFDEHLDAEIPLVEREYGHDLLTGDPLIAYGTVRAHAPVWREDSWQFISYWSQDRSDAVRVCEASNRQLAERASRAELDKLNLELGELKEQLRAARQHPCWDDLSQVQVHGIEHWLYVQSVDREIGEARRKVQDLREFVSEIVEGLEYLQHGDPDDQVVDWDEGDLGSDYEDLDEVEDSGGEDDAAQADPGVLNLTALADAWGARLTDKR